MHAKFPGGLTGKEFICNVGDLGLIPGFGKIPWRRERLPTPVFWPAEFHGPYSPLDHKESDTTTWLSLSDGGSKMLKQYRKGRTIPRSWAGASGRWGRLPVGAHSYQWFLVYKYLWGRTRSLNWASCTSIIYLLLSMWGASIRKWMIYDDSWEQSSKHRNSREQNCSWCVC